MLKLRLPLLCPPFFWAKKLINTLSSSSMSLNTCCLLTSSHLLSIMTSRFMFSLNVFVCSDLHIHPTMITRYAVHLSAPFIPYIKLAYWFVALSVASSLYPNHLSILLLNSNTFPSLCSTRLWPRCSVQRTPGTWGFLDRREHAYDSTMNIHTLEHPFMVAGRRAPSCDRIDVCILCTTIRVRI